MPPRDDSGTARVLISMTAAELAEIDEAARAAGLDAAGVHPVDRAGGGAAAAAGAQGGVVNYLDLAVLSIGPYVYMQAIEAREKARFDEWLFLWEFVGWHFAAYIPRPTASTDAMTYDELDRLIYEVGAENDDHLCQHQRCTERGQVIENCGDALVEIRRQMQTAQELIAALLPGGLDNAQGDADVDNPRVAAAITAYRAAWAL